MEILSFGILPNVLLQQKKNLSLRYDRSKGDKLIFFLVSCRTAVVFSGNNKQFLKYHPTYVHGSDRIYLVSNLGGKKGLTT